MSRMVSPKQIVDAGLCIGCGSCVAAPGGMDKRMQLDEYGQLKPAGDPHWYAQPTAEFTSICPFSPGASNEDELAAVVFPDLNTHDPHLGKFQSAYVGYVAEEEFRLRGSSGGMVTWMATELLRKGLIDGVAHVVPCEDPQKDGRYFRYRIARTEAEIIAGAKSRYYPIELSEVLTVISKVPGRYAVVGIPCFIKAVHLQRQQDPLLRERICFTLGLFCGHMKSARFIESFAWQMNVPVTDIRQVEFRHKDPSRPANWYNARLTMRNGEVVNRDWWHLADGDWGAGYFMNSACNFCDDVVAETADISFGDAWVEPYSSDGKGTNVVVVRSSEVAALVEAAIAEKRLVLDVVDSEFVVQTQAAGFRQRREGLAYRLAMRTHSLTPRKRVAPDASTPTNQRKLIYRMRGFITAGSHRVFRVARHLRLPQLYIRWARMAAGLYAGLAYYRGRVGAVVKRLMK